MNTVALLRREAVALGGVVLTAYVAAVSSGDTGTVALKSVVPLVVAAVLRQLTQSTATKGDPMADLSTLSQAVAQLQTDAQSVATHVAQLKADATPQADVDAVTAQVQQASQQINAAIQ